MKYHPIIKGLAIFLAAAALLACVAGALGAIYLANHNLYTNDWDTWMYIRQEEMAYSIADDVLTRYSDKAYSNCPALLLEYMGRNRTDESISSLHVLNRADWQYRIEDGEGKLVDGSPETGFIEGMSRFRFEMDGQYLRLVDQREIYAVDTPEPEYWEPTQVPTEMPAEIVDAIPDMDTGTVYDNCNVYEINGQEYFYSYQTAGRHTVTVWLAVGALGNLDQHWVQVLQWLYPHRITCLWVCVGSLLAFVLLLTYLGFAAGRSRKSDVRRAGGLNRIPLDLYLLVAGGLCTLTVIGGVVLLSVGFVSLDGDNSQAAAPWLLTVGVAALLVAAVLGVAMLFAFAAQVKTPDHFWWRNSILGRFCHVLGRLFRFLFRAIRRVFSLLPLMWQWIVTAIAMMLVPTFFLFLLVFFFGKIISGFCLICAVALDIAIVCYGAYAFGVLRKGAKAMSEGNLEYKLSTKYLFGCFRQFADHLNAVSDAAMVAAQNEMKSERMKTELITNVSHDIKTPLTSIINFVDLLKKPHTEAEGQQYLEVLDRQSQRLKKLVDDLMEMSKASTGNMPVNLETLDIAETVNQALGEFADRLEGKDLQVVFKSPAEPVRFTADGRLTWRVLSNILSNVVKYSLPGTRVYMDINRFNSNVLLSVKNISRESLNVSAQELTERFVRGDASRNTEGSGLGLNIAQSLMELQNGRLSLLVDGDLFKVTLTFPAAE